MLRKFRFCSWSLSQDTVFLVWFSGYKCLNPQPDNRFLAYSVFLLYNV